MWLAATVSVQVVTLSGVCKSKWAWFASGIRRAVVAAVPGFAALGSSGGRFPRLPLYVEVGVVVIVQGS